jgi:hypothetical protein
MPHELKKPLHTAAVKGSTSAEAPLSTPHPAPVLIPPFAFAKAVSTVTRLKVLKHQDCNAPTLWSTAEGQGQSSACPSGACPAHDQGHYGTGSAPSRSGPRPLRHHGSTAVICRPVMSYLHLRPVTCTVSCAMTCSVKAILSYCAAPAAASAPSVSELAPHLLPCPHA